MMTSMYSWSSDFTRYILILSNGTKIMGSMEGVVIFAKKWRVRYFYQDGDEVIKASSLLAHLQMGNKEKKHKKVVRHHALNCLSIDSGTVLEG